MPYGRCASVGQRYRTGVGTVSAHAAPQLWQHTMRSCDPEQDKVP